MAESAARAGYAVTTLDAFGDLDQHAGVHALSLPRDFGVAFSAEAAASVASEISGAISGDAVAYLSPFENHPRALAELAKGRALWGNAPAVLHRVRDPLTVAQVLARHGLASPDVRSAIAPLSHDDAVHRWLVKPRASGGGHGVHWWQPDDVVPHSSHLQRFIDGVPASIVFAAARCSAIPLGLTRQIVGDEAFGATGFRYCGSILAPASDAQLGRDAELLAAASELASRLTYEFDLIGVNGIDFIARDGVPVPIEVNPRYSASMELVEQAYGVSIFEAHAAACLHGDLPAFTLARARATGAAYGKAIVFARHDVTCGDTRGWLDDPSVRDVPHPDELIPAGRPVCTVFARGADSADCYASLVRRAEALYVTLESWASTAV
jgi:predicted ATP-grasp superfamily ATP-dependent carboligase